jgi:V8-like Glu-specific endopeptidase
MSARALLPFGLLVLGGCAARSAGDPGSAADPGAGAEVEAKAAGRTSSAIVSGTPSTASQDSTVLIAVGTDGQFCTGALIAPNLVITARHCVQGTDETSECGSYTTRNGPNTLGVAVGVSASGTSLAAHGKKTFVDSGTSMCSHDIALILLDQDIPGASIATVRFAKVEAGETTTTVGYGDNGFGTPTATRYQRDSLKITAVGPASHTYTTKDQKAIAFTVHPGEIATGESTCFGDSGGPLFDAQGSIIGMTSRGLDGECIDRPSIFTDTASHADLIAQAATEAGHPIDVSASQADTSTGDPSSSADDGATTTPTTAKSKGNAYTLQPQANAGCSVTRSRERPRVGGQVMEWPVFSAIGVLVVVVRRRRRSSSAG